MKCFRFIRAEKANHSISLMARVLSVSRAGYYAWERRAPCARERFDAELRRRVRPIHAGAGSRGSYGAPRVHAQLRREGVRVSRKRVERLMCEAGLQGRPRRRRRRATTTRVPGVRPAPDLVERDFNPAAPNRLWCADLTEIPTGEGKLYLAAAVDCFSRALVGWSVAERMPAELVVDALEMAVRRRRPGPGLVHHSDQGSQYTSLVFGKAAREAGVARSMGSKGDCYDNAVCESFFATLKRELVNVSPFATRDQARGAIFEWIEIDYNRARLHSTLGHLSPAEFECAYERGELAA